MRLRLLPLLLLSLAPACKTLSVEARGIVVDDAEGRLSTLDEEDVDLTGYGLHLAFETPIVDLVAGVDQREFESSDSPELDLGLRKRLLRIWGLSPYIEANVRYGFDLDTGAVSEDYFGWSGGFGALLDVSESMFLNLRIMYDATEIDVGIDEIDVDGLIGTIGLGLRF